MIFNTIMEAIVIMVGLACALGFGYENRMQRAGRFVDLGNLTTKKQIKLTFIVCFALVPVLIVVWIFTPHLQKELVEGIVWLLVEVQFAIDFVYLITMDIVCKVQARKNNILKQLPIILNQKTVLDGNVTPDYDFVKHELYLWYGVKYTTKEIDNALTKLNLDLSTFANKTQI